MNLMRTLERRTHALAATACVIAAGASLLAAAGWEPARLRSGSIPQPSIRALGGGEVFIEASVAADGTVTAVRPLRTTPPFTEMLTTAARTWEFAPAIDASSAALAQNRGVALPVASKVLVGAVFRPPALLGPTLGTPTVDVGRPGDDAPFPLATTMPPYPTHARDGASVLIEMQVAEDGSVADVAVVRSAPPFDEPAMTAARSWRFRPAVVNRRPVLSRAYVVFGFPAPILGSPGNIGP